MGRMPQSEKGQRAFERLRGGVQRSQTPSVSRATGHFSRKEERFLSERREELDGYGANAPKRERPKGFRAAARRSSEKPNSFREPRNRPFFAQRGEISLRKARRIGRVWGECPSISPSAPGTFPHTSRLEPSAPRASPFPRSDRPLPRGSDPNPEWWKGDGR